MEASQKSAFWLGALAALLWSPHFFIVESLRRAGVPLLVAQFHLVFWPALVLGVVVFLSGRGAVVSAFRGQAPHVLALAAVGGYGFWVLRTVALDSPAVPYAQALFYAAPAVIGLLSAFTPERAGPRLGGALFLGFVGCALIAAGQHGEGAAGFRLGAALAALGAAACWALFSVLARPLVREEEALPVAALTTGVGAICLFVTCLSTGESIFRVSMGQLSALALTGLFTVGLMMLLWLRCLSKVSAAQAAPLWYVGALFGIGWALVSGRGVSLWWTFAGVVLVLVALRRGLTGRQRVAVTIGDIIRG
jgi:drug/metabolite transporter (DMT)-like permease